MSETGAGWLERLVGHRRCTLQTGAYGPFLGPLMRVPSSLFRIGNPDQMVTPHLGLLLRAVFISHRVLVHGKDMGLEDEAMGFVRSGRDPLY